MLAQQIKGQSEHEEITAYWQVLSCARIVRSVILKGTWFLYRSVTMQPVYATFGNQQTDTHYREAWLNRHMGALTYSCMYEKGHWTALTGQAFVRILCVLVHSVIRDGVLWDGLHLHSGSMRQHPQVLKQTLPEQTHTQSQRNQTPLEPFKELQQGKNIA